VLIRPPGRRLGHWIVCAAGGEAVTVYDPELAAFTLGGGGAHCLMQAIRRERVG